MQQLLCVKKWRGQTVCASPNFKVGGGGWGAGPPAPSSYAPVNVVRVLNKYERYYRPGRRPLAYLLYGKSRLYINIHHYTPPIGSTALRAAGGAVHRAATSLAAAGRCGVSEGSVSSSKSTT